MQISHFSKVPNWPSSAPTQPIFKKIRRLPDWNLAKISRLPDQNFDQQVLWATLTRVATPVELPPTGRPPVTTSRL
jgi:hypothetical protein